MSDDRICLCFANEPPILSHRSRGEQRVSGRWWMQSLYRGNYQFSTCIATAQALRALAMCGELPALVGAE
jgi:hypothetical protein